MVFTANVAGEATSAAAAAGVSTTRLSLKPSGNACTTRSTPGCTARYVAVEPDMTGVGSVHGESRLYEWPAWVIVASGTDTPPPSEKLIDTDAAFGVIVDPETTKPVSIGNHEPFDC